MKINPLSTHSNAFAYLSYKFPQMVNSFADIPVIDLTSDEWNEFSLTGYGYLVKEKDIAHIQSQLAGHSQERLQQYRSMHPEINRDLQIYDLYKRIGTAPFFIILEGNEAAIIHEVAHVVWNQLSPEEQAQIDLPEVSAPDKDEYITSDHERFTHMTEMEYFKSQGMNFDDYFRRHNARDYELINDSTADPKLRELAQMDYNDYQAIWNHAKTSSSFRRNWFMKMAAVPDVSGVVPEVPAEPTATSVTDQSWEETEPKSRWYGFPIKKSIYETMVPVEVEGQQLEVKVSLNRWFRKGRRRIPSYVYDIAWKDKLIGRLAKPSPSDWGSYDEGEIAGAIPELIRTRFAAGPKSKMYNGLKHYLELSGREPELTEYLKQFDHDKKIEKSIHLEEPGYEGDYPVKFFAYTKGENWYGETALDHPQAPRPKTIYYLGDVPPNIHSIEQFNQWLEGRINEPEVMERAKKGYADYLKSFHFSEVEQEEAAGQFQEILPIIEGRVTDPKFFRQKLMEHGYIRPSRRRRRNVPGMQPQESIEILLDSRKIVDDSYGWGKLSKSPNYLYSVVAYLMHRHKAGNIGFGAGYGQIGSSIRSFHDTLQRHGATIDVGELYDYLDDLAKQLLREVIGIQPAGSAADQWARFYSGEEGVGSSESPASVLSRGLDPFVQFAVQHGLDEATIRANPVKAYRTLAHRFHPDLNQGNPEAGNLFRELGALWDAVPAEVKKTSENWLHKVYYGS